MELQYIAFKWCIELSLDRLSTALEQLSLRPAPTKRHEWSRSVGEHIMRVEYRPQLSTKECSFLWIRWEHPTGHTDKNAFDRLLADWFFTMSQYAPVNVYWMQAVIGATDFRSLYGYEETSPKIWTKEDNPHRFSFYPIRSGFYHFEVRCKEKMKAIQHKRYSIWLEELSNNLLGRERPDDQILFDLTAAAG
ncbi:hypothetical protein [Paenibacillus sp. MMO-58]|uniref:hypothetical protein n=1 Tax=Paenibacillus sp. MMO-58 TaxID=3081290 RepID=UPI003018EF56